MTDSDSVSSWRDTYISTSSSVQGLVKCNDELANYPPCLTTRNKNQEAKAPTSKPGSITNIPSAYISAQKLHFFLPRRLLHRRPRQPKHWHTLRHSPHHRLGDFHIQHPIRLHMIQSHPFHIQAPSPGPNLLNSNGSKFIRTKFHLTPAETL